MLTDFSTYTSFMLSDACHNWVHVERGLEVARDEDPAAELTTIIATTVRCYRALAGVGTEFGWFTADDPGTFHAYNAATGELSPDLVTEIEALGEVPSPSTLGFFRNVQPYSPQLAERAVSLLRGRERAD